MKVVFGLLQSLLVALSESLTSGYGGDDGGVFMAEQFTVSPLLKNGAIAHDKMQSASLIVGSR